jgi:hypothetical protein
MSAISDNSEPQYHAPKAHILEESNDKYTPRSGFENNELPLAKPRISVKIKQNHIDMDHVRDYPTDDSLGPAGLMPMIQSELRHRPTTPRQSTKYRTRIQSETVDTQGYVESNSNLGRHDARNNSELPIQRGYTVDFAHEFESERRLSAWEAQNMQQYQRRKSVPASYPTPPNHPMIQNTSPRIQKARVQSPYGDIESDHSDSEPKVAPRLSASSVVYKSRNSLKRTSIVKEKQPHSTTDEKERIRIVEQLGILRAGPLERVDLITKLASNLLRKPICVFSVVGADKAVTKSSFSHEQEVPLEEPRYLSLCSWVVQDDYGCVIICDAKKDPRCTHMKLKSSMDFFLGVPVVFRDLYAVGALSVRGPASSPCSDHDILLLKHLSQMISLELEQMWSQNRLRDSQAVLDLQTLINDAQSESQAKDHRVLEKKLAIMNQTYRSSCTMILKLSADVTGFQSHLHAYSVTSNFVRMTSLSIGKELLRDLAILALVRPDASQALLYLNQPGSNIHRELEYYFTKPIGMCVAECMYTSSGPHALLVSCFEESRQLCDFELEGYSKVAYAVSNLYQQIEVRESLISSQKLFKEVLKDFEASHGQDLYPIVVVMQAVIPTEPGSQIHSNGRYSTSPECFETLNDFTQIINVCSEKAQLRKPKRYGNYFCIADSSRSDSECRSKLWHSRTSSPNVS